LEKVVEDLKTDLKPWYKTSWKEAWSNFFFSGVWKNARRAARIAGRSAAFDNAWKTAKLTALDAIGHSAWYAAGYDAWKVACDVAEKAAADFAWYVALEVVRDIEGYENNPYEKLIKIYDMGLYPRGFIKVMREERYFVDFPLKTNKLGCWAEGDKQISYQHEWFENCKERKPAIFQKQ
jgi:hypothetical protein